MQNIRIHLDKAKYQLETHRRNQWGSVQMGKGAHLEGLDAGQVTAKLIRGKDDVFFGDPGDRLVGVAVKALDLVGAEQK